MDLIVYDKQFNPLKLVDTYDSLIWTERLYSPGDFELVVRPSTEAFQLFSEGNYVWNREAKEKYQEYTVLEYLETTGKQYIDTGLTVDSDTWIDITLSFTAPFGWNMMAGMWGSPVVALNGSGAMYVGSTTVSGFAYNQKHRYRFGQGIDYVDDTLVHNNYSPITPSDRHIFMFAVADRNATPIPYTWDSGAGRYALGKIYSAKFYKGNPTNPESLILVRDFIPVRRDSDGAVGMLDKVNNVLYQNNGSGVFTTGPVIGKFGPEKILRKLMIIEKNELQTDPENGNKLIISGRSLESILDRRIIWKQTEINSAFQTAVQRLLNENIISPDSAHGGANRRISNFKFVSSSDPVVTALRLEAQYTGDNLMEVMNKNCEDFKIGYRIEVNDSNEFIFQLYAGKDHSYNQTSNPYVCFRPEFDNLLNSNYKHSMETFKNITHIGGEGEGTARIYATYFSGSSEPSGLDRKEMFTDARDLSKDTYNEDGTKKTLSAAEYEAVLKERGTEKLVECKITTEFEAEIETTQQYKFKEDFDLGDKVQIVNEYGIEGVALITEVVRSVDQSGFKTYPAFTIIM